jgi:Mg-chelatase subunit ChlD
MSAAACGGKALTFIVRKLTDRDRQSIVKFDHEAAPVCRLCRVTDEARTELEACVSGLQTRGATNIELGLRTGLAVVEGRKFAAGRAASIMLLSDGGQTEGDVRIVVLQDVLVHTFGFGARHDSTLLGDVAKNSLGGVYNLMVWGVVRARSSR